MVPRSPGGCKPWAFVPADHATLTVAKRACRTADRLDPTRVPRPCRGVGGTAPPSSVGELRDLLQRGAHAPCARQGYAAPSTCADSRAYRISHLARRSPSALCEDRIIGRHSGFTERYDYALQTLTENPYGAWREYDAEDTVRFYALRLHELGMIKSSPQKIIAKGTDWRFLNELKRELKT